MRLHFESKWSRYPFVLVIILYVCNLLTKSAESTWDSEFNDEGRSLPEDVEIFDVGSSIKIPDTVYRPKIKSVLMSSKIRFRYARTRIISTIENPDPNKSHEVNFKFRIPKEAFITQFEMRIDGGPERYKANVTSKEYARKLFESAKSEGRTVSLGLVEQTEKFDKFSVKFIIGAKKMILFLLIYEERISRTMGVYESIIYLDPEQLSNKTMYRIEMTIEEKEKITSINVPTSDETNCDFSYRNTKIENTSSNQAKIFWSNKLEDTEIFCDYPFKEFVVTYSLQDEVPNGYVLMRDGYFVHFFSPPNELQPLRKHVVFVLDISDSMEGTKLEQLQNAIKEILDELMLEDFFNIIAFSTDVEIWSFFGGSKRQFLFPYQATARHKESATYFVEHLKPRGSTNIYSALTTALQLCKNVSSSSTTKRYKPSRFEEAISQTLPNDVQSIIIFFTDGEPTSGIVDKRVILTAIKTLNYQSQIPIYSLAFGNSADFAFLTKVSLRNKAFARKVYEDADASLQLADFYREISSPILTNLSFQYTTSPSTSGIRQVSKSGYPTIFKGAEILVSGKLKRINQEGNTISLTASVEGNGRSGKIVYNSEIRDCTVSGTCGDALETDDKAMEKLFVYLTIKSLLRRIAAYENGSSLCWTKKDHSDFYDDWFEIDNPDNNCVVELRDKIIELAMQHGFVTPYTSLVMKTKSILEEEMDVHKNSEELNGDWELFLGNVTPLPENAKLTLEGSKKEIAEAFKYPELPIPHAQIQSNLDYHRKHPQNRYNIVDIHRNSTLLNSLGLLPFVNSQNYSILVTNSPQNYSSTHLTLKNITWLELLPSQDPQGQAIFAQIPANNSLLKTSVMDGQAVPLRLKLNLPCTSKAVVNGTCEHLSSCVRSEFLDDFQLYVQSYWCPLSYEEQMYLGVCCQKIPIS